MNKIAVMGKNTNRTFEIQDETGDMVTLLEEKDGAQPKTIKLSTFKKSYKVVDVPDIVSRETVPDFTPQADSDSSKPYEEDPLPDDWVDAKIDSGWNLMPSDRDDLVDNSMRANREAKFEGAKPFIPEPFFLRQSMINSYLQCPDKMYDTYENGYNEETIFTKVGTAIHGIMEDYYDNDLDNTSVDELFEKWWTKHSTSEWDWYRDWKHMIDDYFNRMAKYDRPYVIAVELEFKVTINGVPVSGTIDRVDRVDDDTIRLVDYKTNFRPFTDHELNESIQFQMYSLAVRQLKDRLGEFNKVECVYDMLRLGYRQHTSFTVEELDVFAGWMKTIWTKILGGLDRKPKLNQYCGYCQKRHKCDLYREQLNAPIKSILTENTNISSVVGEKETLFKNKKLLDNRIKEINEIIKSQIAENGGKVEVGDYVWTTKSNIRKTYPTQDVMRVLAMNGKSEILPDILNVGVTNLKKALKNDNDLMGKIDEIKEVSYTSPQLNKKKIK